MFNRNLNKIRRRHLIKSTYFTKNICSLLPLFGTVIFVCLYILATQFYPGGSSIDEHSKGFSWTHNYWCNLLDEHSINGQYNTARPTALTATLVLILTLAIFWYIFPMQVGLDKRSRLIIQISGAMSMIIGMFLFTNHHDIVIIAASFCGLVATMGTFVALSRLKWKNLFRLGIFNMALVALNNVLYYGEGLLLYLPVVQKITMLFFYFGFA